MRALSAHDILKIWEIGQDQHLPERALIMLAFACPGKTRDELASCSVAQRDRLLLDLRRQLLGPTMRAFAVCPRCSERLEFTVSADDLKVPACIADETPMELKTGDLELRFRFPNSSDLAAVVGCGDMETARRSLAARCVLETMRNGVRVEAKPLSPELVTALEDRFEDAGSQAEVLLDLNCPACGHGWQMIFDIVSFFWEELQAEARRLLLEVHTLASAYGWREADVLSLSPLRRRFYLDMVD